jgi:SAM-dependent methyltransferase
MSLISHYDRKYATPEQPPAPVPRVVYPADRFEMLVAVAAQGARGRYLEVGAGNGRTLLALESCYDELVATEYAPARVEQLQRLFADHPRVRVLRNDLENERLEFPDDHFDTIAMSAVIEHLVDPIRALGELRRLLRPGGRLLLDTPNIAKWTRRLKLAAGFFPSTASLDEGLLTYDRKTPTDLHDEGHLHYFTFRSLRRICIERAGFTSVQPRGYGRTFLSRRWPTLFSDVFLVAVK